MEFHKVATHSKYCLTYFLDFYTSFIKSTLSRNTALFLDKANTTLWQVWPEYVDEILPFEVNYFTYIPDFPTYLN
jgi:hypothetical protein